MVIQNGDEESTVTEQGECSNSQRTGPLLLFRTPESRPDVGWPSLFMNGANVDIQIETGERPLQTLHSHQFMYGGNIHNRAMTILISDRRAAFICRDLATHGGGTVDQIKAAHQRSQDAKAGAALTGHIRWDHLRSVKAYATMRRTWSGSITLE